VWVPAGEPAASGGPVPWRRAEAGEKGEVVIARPYPYLCRTIWGDADGFAVEHDGAGLRVRDAWRGDGERYAATYWSRWQGAWAYTQGDFAVRHADGSFSLHGRSDDVINVSGHRLGTEEIEGAILRDRQLDPESPVGNVVVVGAPHREKGLTPLAFVRCAPGRRLTADDRRRLAELVRQEKGAPAVPSDFIEVTQFPETRSGKYVRRMVRAVVESRDPGDASTLRNPESLDELRAAVGRWRARQDASDTQRVLERWRYFRVGVHPLAGPGSPCVAVVHAANPPVNALNERALDELATLAEHLSGATRWRGSSSPATAGRSSPAPTCDSCSRRSTRSPTRSRCPTRRTSRSGRSRGWTSRASPRSTASPLGGGPRVRARLPLPHGRADRRLRLPEIRYAVLPATAPQCSRLRACSLTWAPDGMAAVARDASRGRTCGRRAARARARRRGGPGGSDAVCRARSAPGGASCHRAPDGRPPPHARGVRRATRSATGWARAG
jgi:hypothetical protein